MHPVKTQISLGIHPVCSESSLSAWRKLGSLATHSAHSEDWSDWMDAQADLSLCWAHTILLVLLCQNDKQYDPDQTASASGDVWSGSSLFTQTCLYENFGSLRYILITFLVVLLKGKIILLSQVNGKLVTSSNHTEVVAMIKGKKLFQILSRFFYWHPNQPTFPQKFIFLYMSQTLYQICIVFLWLSPLDQWKGSRHSLLPSGSVLATFAGYSYADYLPTLGKKNM